MILPIVNQTKDQVFDRYNQSPLFSFLRRKSSSTNQLYVINFFHRYMNALTSLFTTMETYCNYVLNELNDYMDISRSLWKNVNMADGRSLDEVEV